MPMSEGEKHGVADLLLVEGQNIPTLMQLAKSVTKNVVDVDSAQEALDIIYTHIGDAATLLNKRHITKEILFKYLHHRKVVVKTDFTKGALVNKVLEYWQTNTQDDSNIINTYASPSATYDASYAPQNEHRLAQNGYAQNQNNDSYQLSEEEEFSYPINLLARKFSEWFFENYNKDMLQLVDFWSDVRLLLRIVANDGVKVHEYIGAEAVLENLLNNKSHFGFYFNPNLTHDGVQGRMNNHGLVLALACGTLHTQQNCVGVFECTFGLLRDPFAENNWKMKTLQCTLRSEEVLQVPSLTRSPTFQATLALPMPTGEIT